MVLLLFSSLHVINLARSTTMVFVNCDAIQVICGLVFARAKSRCFDLSLLF